jgi:cell division septation protein DedD
MVRTRAAALKSAVNKVQAKPEEKSTTLVAGANGIDNGLMATEDDAVTNKVETATASASDSVANDSAVSKPTKKPGKKRAAQTGEATKKPAKRTRKGDARQVRGGWDVLPHGMGILPTNKVSGDKVSPD